jgi:DNA modification methylase
MILTGDCRELLKTLENKSIDCCITSPPYFGLRNYGHKDQLGLENTPIEYVENLVNVFREVRRVLKDEGTLYT